MSCFTVLPCMLDNRYKRVSPKSSCSARRSRLILREHPLAIALAASAARTVAAFPSGVSAAGGLASLPPTTAVPDAPGRLRRRRGSVMILGIGRSSRSRETLAAAWKA